MTKTTIFLLLLSLIIAGLLSFYQYLYKVKNKSKLNLFLTFLRFVSYFTVFLLLINPIISRKTLETSKTPLPIFFDNSQSISELEASENTTKIYKALSENSKLKDKFEIQTYLFDDEIYQDKALDFKGKQSKIDQVSKDIKQLYKAPLFPVILVTDGNQTQGSDYIYSFQSNANVFPVVVGDTTEVEDLKINQVNVNKYAFLKNKFPIEVFSQYNGQDVLKDDYKPRAFIATYQDLGLIKDNVLTIISPVKQSKQFALKQIDNPKLGTDFSIYYEENFLKTKREDLIKECTAFYQTASDMLSKKKYDVK